MNLCTVLCVLLNLWKKLWKCVWIWRENEPKYESEIGIIRVLVVRHYKADYSSMIQNYSDMVKRRFFISDSIFLLRDWKIYLDSKSQLLLSEAGRNFYFATDKLFDWNHCVMSHLYLCALISRFLSVDRLQVCYSMDENRSIWLLFLIFDVRKLMFLMSFPKSSLLMLYLF